MPTSRPEPDRCLDPLNTATRISHGRIAPETIALPTRHTHNGAPAISDAEVSRHDTPTDEQQGRLQNLSSSISMTAVEQKFQKDFGEILRSHLNQYGHEQGAPPPAAGAAGTHLPERACLCTCTCCTAHVSDDGMQRACAELTCVQSYDMPERLPDRRCS